MSNQNDDIGLCTVHMTRKLQKSGFPGRKLNNFSCRSFPLNKWGFI